MNINYYNIYIKIIKNRKNNPLARNICYCEKHHIIPKSIGGTDDEDNLVFLTAREHYVCHELLCFHYKSIGDYIAYRKMLFAWNRMAYDGKERKINSRLFDILKREYNLDRLQYKPSKEAIEKMRIKLIGRKLSEEHKKKISQGCIGKKRDDKFKNKISKIMKGCRYLFNPNSNETRRFYDKDIQKYINDGWISCNPLINIKRHDKESGSKNPSFGKKWIFNIKTDERKYLPKGEAQIFLVHNKDWKYGVSRKTKEKQILKRTGLKRSEESKKNMSIKMKGIKWMIKGNTCKRVTLNHIEEYIKDGWILK